MKQTLKMQPIATAPYSVAVMTDVGMLVRMPSTRWSKERWARCDMDGSSFSCADYGRWYENPTMWCHIPEFELESRDGE